jgi:hypothetical protein
MCVCPQFPRKEQAMAKRYHSAMLSETSGFCHLPDQVVNKQYPSDTGYNGKAVKDLYSCVEEQMGSDRSDLQRATNPKKI